VTRSERQIEHAYRVAERLGILTEGEPPKLSQFYVAETEATAACDEIDRLDKLEQTNQGELRL
jgi:hypothetical protein